MSTWKNRIIGSGEESPDQLLANPFNWKIHTSAQQEAITGILEEIGWVQQVVVNRRTGHMVDGHMRVALAMRYNEPTVPVLYVDLSENEERIILMTLDTITAMAGTDKENLEELLREANTTDAAIQSFLGNLADDKGLFKQKRGGASSGSDNGSEGSTSSQHTASSPGSNPAAANPEGSGRDEFPEFREITEEIENTIDFHQCPSCGHRWPK